MIENDGICSVNLLTEENVTRKFKKKTDPLELDNWTIDILPFFLEKTSYFDYEYLREKKFSYPDPSSLYEFHKIKKPFHLKFPFSVRSKPDATNCGHQILM
jgi:hypothetical protein